MLITTTYYGNHSIPAMHTPVPDTIRVIINVGMFALQQPARVPPARCVPFLAALATWHVVFVSLATTRRASLAHHQPGHALREMP